MDENKRNLQYFEAESMVELFDALQAWQHDKEKRFLSARHPERSGEVLLHRPDQPIGGGSSWTRAATTLPVST